ncbi:hypothetical protein AB0F72_40770 [Actinoplanes sp. NPDC023936]|uniref:hypothetical protein n=1 Tax=Actinoplanes sp. NPDC023936 TaxID=3154910 RepID=UPI0033C762E9
MTSSDDLHAQAESVAVPSFDWMSTPVLSVVDGFLHIDPDAPLPRRRYRPAASVTPEHAPADGVTVESSRLLAGLTRFHTRH